MKSGVIILLVYFLSGITPTFGETISGEEKKGILYMREEEKLAHDVYQAMYEKWGIPVFGNISNSETRHFNAIGFLIQSFELEDPSTNVAGEFANKHLQQLYDSLIVVGEISMIDAFAVGAYIEEVDITDLQNLISSTENELILQVCQNLKGASENHLRAFTRQINFRDTAYTPKVLTTTEYNAIINTEFQRGPGNGMCMKPQNNNRNCTNNSCGKRMRKRGGNF